GGYYPASFDTTTLQDGNYTFTVIGTDMAGNVNNTESVVFTIDNDPPYSVIGYTTGYVQPSASQVIMVEVRDLGLTASSITLHYKFVPNGAEQTTTMTGTQSQATNYTATIETTGLANGSRIEYYVTGTDYVGHNIPSTGNNASSPLETLYIDTDGPTIYVNAPSPSITDNTPLFNLTTLENATCAYSLMDVQFSSMTQFTTTGGTNHLTNLSTLTDSYYTYYFKCRDSAGNIGRTQVTFDLDTRSLYNVTRPAVKHNYWLSGWNAFALPEWLIDQTELSDNNVTTVLASVDGNYEAVWADLGNNGTWYSYVPGRPVNDFTSFTYNGSAEVYYIKMNTTDRLEIN
ncbi:MAG: hypothetical protein GXO64_00740, partial [Candidatus Micrarchaeota archaeon]|nr:hypothetical protein [Candidatus Micrarchaeota archaeon]